LKLGIDTQDPSVKRSISIKNDYAINGESLPFNESESCSLSEKSLIDEEGILSKESTTPARLVGNSTFSNNIVALLTKRINIYKRDKSGIMCEVFLPWIVVLLGCLVTLLVFNKP
jgi:hypothetical protein